MAEKSYGRQCWVVVIPHMNWRGLFSMGTAPSGANSTVPVEWPGFRTTAYHSMGQTQATTKNWMGSLLEGQRDAGGQMYMRNRYYDPATGQFTQTDPIGLGGGLNTYGFAAGDPVSYSDPYGLCAEEKRNQRGECPGGLTVREWQAVERAAGNLRPEGRDLALEMLAAGKIHSNGLSSRLLGQWSLRGITLNTRTEYGSAFEWSTEALSYLLAHELGHEADYRERLERSGSYFVPVLQNAVFRLLPYEQRPQERKANAYACEMVIRGLPEQNREYCGSPR